MSGEPYVDLPPAHRAEQYRTCSQSRDHFFRQVKRRPQAAQTLLGRSAFFVPRGMGPSTLHSWQELDAAVMRTLACIRDADHTCGRGSGPQPKRESSVVAGSWRPGQLHLTIRDPDVAEDIPRCGHPGPERPLDTPSG